MTPETITVLIVDDDVTYVSLVKYLLESYSQSQFTVLSENNGDSALSLLKSHP